MLREFFGAVDIEAAGEAMRRLHSLWLSAALRRGARPPRIPVRRVDAGGWDEMLATAEGRAWAEEFWQGAFEHPDVG